MKSLLKRTACVITNFFGRWLKKALRKYLPGLYSHMLYLQTCSFAEPGDIVMQVGVDLGVKKHLSDAILLSRRVGPGGKVLAVEPDKRNIQLLKDYIEEKSISNIQIIEKAAWKEKTTLTFKLGKKTCWSRLEGVDALAPNGEFVGTLEAQADTIDNILAENNIKNISHIHLSINGSEFEALEGMSRTLSSRNIKLRIQVNDYIRPKVDEMSYFEKITSILSGYGYRADLGKHQIVACKT